MLGAVVSATVTLLAHELVFPEVSCALKLTVVVPRGYVAAPGLVTVVGEQTSLAVAFPGSTYAASIPVHSAVTGAGQVMLGFVVSATVMLVVQLLERPL
jgi:hypothetical protein